jgi:hypothetical protein
VSSQINAPDEFPPGGLTPVFNEISVLFALSPSRPAPEQSIDDIDGPTERVLMQNVIDRETGVVQPTIFVRSDTFRDTNSGRLTQVLSLAADSAITTSVLFGGELAVHVRGPGELPAEARRELPKEAEEALHVAPYGGPAATPRTRSIGKIESVSPKSSFPARVAIPVHYSFISGGADGKLETVSDNFTAVAKEPHLMEAVVNSIPPDPDTVLSAREWNLVDESAFLKLWIRVEGFRFLGIGDWEHTKRLTYEGKRKRS